ncbi:conjugal transfer protein [Halomonas sp. 3D7M]|uniref:conjugal transfer protein n=1 Tax=Halomonas sp. 3D7M TaxID=2742617 RepID=UPI001868E7CF|nr:conjugal transfer protein [Halomonas sp. 3D7M]
MKMINSNTVGIGFFALMLVLFPAIGFAAAGGLAAATNALEGFRAWAYGFLAVVVLVYMLYKVMLAFLEKGTWGDVAQSLGFVAIAGGIILAGEFMWAIWGS